MNLQQLRDFTRAQLDVDDEELPNALLDSYIQEGFTRTISMEHRWPFYETAWVVTKPLGAQYIDIPTSADPQMIMAVKDSVTGAPLVQIGNELADIKFVGPSATAEFPWYYSLFGTQIVFHPHFLADAPARDYLIRGYRKPADWIASGAGSEPDCDSRLHQLLAHYAIALFYAQEEDEVLEDTYMKRWQSLFLPAHAAICAPRHQRPVVFNIGTPVRPAGNPVVWSNPPVAP
jgi:hypothetical protein